MAASFMSRRPERPLPRWYLIALGVVGVAGGIAIVVATVSNPTEDALIGIAIAAAPLATLGVAAALRALRSRR